MGRGAQMELELGLMVDIENTVALESEKESWLRPSAGLQPGCQHQVNASFTHKVPGFEGQICTLNVPSRSCQVEWGRKWPEGTFGS